MVDGRETTLREVVAGTSPGDTVSLADGTYTLDEATDGNYTGLYVTTADITIVGESGDASAVILDSNYADHGMQTALISVDAPSVVIAHLTVKRSIFHLIHLWENGDAALIHDVVLEDGGQQFLKASVGEGLVENAEVSCSQFAMTDAGRSNVWGYGAQDGGTGCYTGGIDTHNAAAWHIHDSMFSGIYCDSSLGRPAHGKKAEDRDGQTYAGGLAEHAIHMWDSPSGSGHLIERNFVEDCARGIGIGMSDAVHDTIVRNNIVVSSFAASGEHDVPINVERGVDIGILHNTIVNFDDLAYPNSVEIRWAETDKVTVHGNLVTGLITPRDSALPSLSDNLERAPSSTFTDSMGLDLRPADCASLPAAAPQTEVPDDFEGTPRGANPTPGAYQCAPEEL
jgi:hypothetical protein